MLIIFSENYLPFVILSKTENINLIHYSTMIATEGWFTLSTPDSSITKSDRHDISEITQAKIYTYAKHTKHKQSVNVV
jgi:hypothetical protein